VEERIDLQEPELVPMRPEERQEAVRLLAALIGATRSSLVGADANPQAESFSIGAATRKTGSSDRRGTP
jgi:hypothetical protein